jgi:hypothetical protein
LIAGTTCDWETFGKMAPAKRAAKANDLERSRM